MRFFFRSLLVLLLIHFCYFIYGYLQFEGIRNINIFTEFYRFKFYDDVSISHFFVSMSFLFFFIIFSVRNHSKQLYSVNIRIKTTLLLLLVSGLSASFFLSYSFGLNFKLKSELSETAFNNDKTLLNILNPALYNYTSYSSEKLFNVTNILYPEPYPVIEEIDSTFISEDNYITESKYYSIDTLKFLESDFNNISGKTETVLDSLGFDKNIFLKRIIKKETDKDSILIIYKGTEVNPRYDDDVCIFTKNNSLFGPVEGIPVDVQKYEAAEIRYKLIYKHPKDSLLYNLKKLDTLFSRYNVETQIVPDELTKDILYYRDNSNEHLNAIRNTFDRKALTVKFTTLDKLFYKPNYLHPSIINIYICVIIAVWLFLVVIYFLFYIKNTRIVDKNYQ